MPVFNNVLAGAAGQGGAADYTIERSLRFNGGDSANLQKQFSSSGNSNKWSWSAWVKFNNNTGTQNILNCANGNNFHSLYLLSDGTLKWDDVIGGSDVQLNKVTNRVFRDFSAWYHIVLVVDTAQSTAANRNRMYVNGVQATFASGNDFAQNDTSQFNHGSPFTHNIGSGLSAASPLNAYLADVHFVDGQALTADDFGEPRSTDGVWVPKKFAGSYSSNPDGYNQVWSNGVAGSNQVPNSQAFDGDLTTWAAPNGNSTLTWTPSSTLTVSNSMRVYAARESSGDSITVNFTDGSSFNSFTGDNVFRWYTVTSPAGKTVSNIVWTHTTDKSKVSAIEIDGQILTDASGINSFHLNFSDSSTNEALGFDSAPTIPDLDPKKGMDVITYTGTGSAQNVGGLLFEPGLVWIKERSSTSDHGLWNTVVGSDKYLSSNANASEYTTGTEFVSFDPGGFTVGASTMTNENGQTNVAWCWRAGGPAVPNTSGTTTSQISANTDYGFSIVSFTGTGSTATIGHGLTGQTPKFIIVKKRNGTANWVCYHDSLGANNHIKLSTTAAANTAANIYTSVPTSSVFTLGSETDVNGNNDTFIAYCWSEVPGYSKISGYAGTGANGNKQTTGFRPRWVLIKGTDSTYEWQIFDSERNSSNPRNLKLEPNTSDAEASTGNNVNFYDDGFDFNTNSDKLNGSSKNYIYVAFADRPGNNWDVNNIVTNEGLTANKDNFDVVTYTGNGSSQRIGAKLSSGAISGSGTPANASGTGGWAQVFDGSTSSFVYVSGGTGTVTSKLTLPAAIPFTKLRIYAGQNGTSGTNIQANDVNLSASHTWALSGSWVDVTSSVTSPLTSLALTTVNGNSSNIRAIEIDDQVVIEGDGPGLKFQPDFVWYKQRNSSSYGHDLFDSVRGVNKIINSNNTLAEYTESNRLTAFNADGFTVGNSAPTNASGGSYVAWCWKAGGTAVSNTDGSITSSVSANPSHGFSIVSYTGTGSAATVGHGLNKVPDLIIIKNRDTANEWPVYSSPVGPLQKLMLNSNVAAADTNHFNDVSPTSSVFSVGATQSANKSGDDLIAYCFANVNGHQRIGKYTGSGVYGSPQVVTGFRPRFLMIKSLDNSNGWFMWDSERDSTNPNDALFSADSSNAEQSQANHSINFNDDGFTPDDGNGAFNGNGVEYLYWAIGDDEIGADEDCLVDVPNAVAADEDATDTSGGYQRGNYATLNPLLDPDGQSVTLSNGNLKFVSGAASGNYVTRFATIGMTTGKWYAEFKANATANGVFIGIAGDPNSVSNFIGSTAASAGYLIDGRKANSGSLPSYGSSWGAGDIVSIAFDADAGSLVFYVNGVSQGEAYSGLTSGPYFMGISGTTNVDVDCNFGQQRFKYGLPSGYAALNTTAMTSAIVGHEHFNVKTWTGNGTDNRTVTGYGFQPDFGWIKVRNQYFNHNLQDAIQGTGKYLVSNSNAAATSDNRHIKSFDSDGFTLGTGGFVNGNNESYVGWAWKGASSAVSNTDGSITSSVRANPSAGFSIVSYTGTGANNTIGHGLNAAPEMILVKRTNSAENWGVYHVGIGNGYRLLLDNNSAKSSTTTWNNTTPTSNVFSVGVATLSNGNNDTYIAYCFAPVSGFSTMGVYSGNSSSDGPFIATNFRPAWVMVKAHDGARDWMIFDSARGPFNVNDKSLVANSTTSEISPGYKMDFLSNGFKLRASAMETNNSALNYIYVAFAENPFQANGGVAR